MSVTTAILLFLPPFVATELIAALPGALSAREALERGLRNTGRHLVLWAMTIGVLHYVAKWVMAHGPLW